MSELYNGIPLYDWVLLAGSILLLAGTLFYLVGQREAPPRRRTTSAGNPVRKRGYMP